MKSYIKSSSFFIKEKNRLQYYPYQPNPITHEKNII